MSKVLRIEKLWVKDRRGWQQPYELHGRLVAIVGPIDRGKSSMVDCIGFLFGRHTRFKGAVDDQLLEVKASMRVGAGTFVLRRSKQRPDYVYVEDAVGDPVGTLPIKPSEYEQSLSDWLLAQLELDDAFASVRLPGNKSLDFASDLLPFLYIRQEDIDRFVIRPNTGRDEAARVMATKLLLQLTNPDNERLKAQIQDLKNNISKKHKKAKAISDFLNHSQITNASAVDDEIIHLKEEERKSTQKLQALKEKTQAATWFAQDLQKQVEYSREERAATEGQVDSTFQRQREVAAKVTALDESLAVLAETNQSSQKNQEQLALHYNACPACQARLVGRVVPPDRCSLCQEPLAEAAHAKEKARLQYTRRQAITELEEANAELAKARDSADHARNEFNRAHEALNERTSEAVNPFVDAITAVTKEREFIRGKLASLQRLQEPHQRLKEHTKEIKALSDDLKHKQEKYANIQSDQSDVLENLDEIFRRIVNKFDLPWATGRARLNPSTLLPMVDEQDFDQRGGGSRTAVSVAYSLSLLMYTLENSAGCHLPTLLVLDSPQKNFGHNEHDQDLAARVYRWIIDYFEEQRETVGGSYETLQLVIVDNNVPTAVQNRFDTLIEFKEDTGFIRDLEDPHGIPTSGA